MTREDLRALSRGRFVLADTIFDEIQRILREEAEAQGTPGTTPTE